MLNKKKLYSISFIEGACVMASEICSTKLLAPFFGSSLYVWSSVMAITLGGLACGYFLGGKLSNRENKQTILCYILLAAACCMCTMPFLTCIFNIFAVQFSLIPAVIGSVFLLLFPTMLCMGSASPLIISVLTNEAKDSGENSGKIYAISTVGGIIATFLCGFYLIPDVGVKFTLLYFAISVALVSLFLMSKKTNKLVGLVFLILISLLLFGFTHSEYNKSSIFQTEGILGKVEVRDEPSMENKYIIIRKLLINNIIQTEMNLGTERSVSEYVTLLEKNIPYFSKGKALVLGLGGGIVSNMLIEHNYKVKGVEFDERIIEVARIFFYLNKTTEVVCDDARHFINVSSDRKLYNLVLFDIFKAEEQPAYVITQESLIKLKTMLDTNATILINTHGYLEGEKGLGTQCLLATLKQSGFYLKICTSSKEEDYRNLLIVASQKPLHNHLYNELNEFKISDLKLINKDDQPILEKLNAAANQAWRSNYIKNYILRRYYVNN